MRVLGHREKIILVVCVLVVSIYLFNRVVIQPYQDHQQGMFLKQEQLKRTFQHSRRVLKKSQELKAKYDELKEVFGVASASGKEDALMIARVESAAGASDVHIVNMRPLPMVRKEIEDIFSVEISFDGSWRNISKFLYIAQDRENMFKVEEMNIENYSNTPGVLRGRVVFSRIFLVKDPG